MDKLQSAYEAAIEKLHDAIINGGRHEVAAIYNQIVETLHRLIHGI